MPICKTCGERDYPASTTAPAEPCRCAEPPEYCAACDGTGEVRDMDNVDATLEGDPAEYRDTTPFIDCGECKGTGFKTAGKS